MVECTGLENRRTERSRGFESLPLRQVRFTREVEIPIGWRMEVRKEGFEPRECPVDTHGPERPREGLALGLWPVAG